MWEVENAAEIWAEAAEEWSDTLEAWRAGRASPEDCWEMSEACEFASEEWRQACSELLAALWAGVLPDSTTPQQRRQLVERIRERERVELMTTRQMRRAQTGQMPTQWSSASNPRSSASNPLAVAGFICALCSVLLSWLPGVNVILWVLGIVFSAVGISRSNKQNAPNKGLAVAGLIITLVPMTIIIFDVFFIVIAA